MTPELAELLRRLIDERETVPMPRWILTTAGGYPWPPAGRRRLRKRSQ